MRSWTFRYPSRQHGDALGPHGGLGRAAWRTSAQRHERQVDEAKCFHQTRTVMKNGVKSRPHRAAGRCAGESVAGDNADAGADGTAEDEPAADQAPEMMAGVCCPNFLLITLVGPYQEWVVR